MGCAEMFVIDVSTMWKLSLVVATEVKELVVFNEMLYICMITKKLQVTIKTLRILFIQINITVLRRKYSCFHELFAYVMI